ncbi:hypothetical protein MFIFM68171_10179 [Madurella fahalii]|uniref:Uncharacterized protein n=1 Tax=Madurella fahalii TaxID=1157608 RepID=A0ABQ0GQH7_9PEZI
MKFFSPVCALAAAGLVAAAPAPAHIDVRADTFWNLSGWGNPQCQGNFLWSYQGTGPACVNVRTFAASASYVFNQNTEIQLINFPTCGLSRAASTGDDANTTTVVIEVNNNNGALAARAPSTGCLNTPLMAFRVTPLV